MCCFYLFLPYICCNFIQSLAHHQLPAKFNLQTVAWLLELSHTSLCGAVLDPRAERRGSHLVATGNTYVVQRHGLQPGDFILERRHCDVDEPGGHHLPHSPTHFLNLRGQKDGVRFILRTLGKSIICVYRGETYPDVTFGEWRETIVTRAPAQHQLIGLPFCHSNIGQWTGKH